MIVFALLVLMGLALGLIIYMYLQGEISGSRALSHCLLLVIMMLVFGMTGCGPTADDIKDGCNGPDEYLACASVSGYSNRCCCSSFNEDAAVYTRCN